MKQVRLVDWAKNNNVEVIANEFGSYKDFAPRQSRVNLLHDVRTILKNIKLAGPWGVQRRVRLYNLSFRQPK